MALTFRRSVGLLVALLGLALPLRAGAQATPRPVPADTAAARAEAPRDTLPGGTTAPAAARDTVPRGPAPLDSIAPDTTARDSQAVEERTPPPDPAADEVIRILQRLEGYTSTEFLATDARYRSDQGDLHLLGEAQVEREGSRVIADTIVFNQKTDRARATGNPKATGQSQDLAGDVLLYDLRRRRATALNARTQVTQGATWFVTSDAATVEGTDRIFATHGRFTTCDLSIPHYHFESGQIKVVRNKYLVARPAVLYFGKVPVMLLPFVVQNLEQGRRSGFLVPKFSVTDIVRNSGHTRQISDIGWYWAINEYLGAQVTGTWRSGAYTSLLGNLDYNWKRQFLQGNFGFTRYWEAGGSRQFAVDTRTSWRPDERTNLSGSGRFMTSSRFIRETTIDPMEATQDLQSTFALSRRFDWGSLSLGANRRQSIANDAVQYTFPSFSISPNTITLFRAPNPELASWYNNASLTWGLTGSRTGNTGGSDLRRPQRDQESTNLQGGISSISIGKLSLSATGQLNQTVVGELVRRDNGGAVVDTLRAGNQDQASWQASLGYQQNLIGQTSLTPSLGVSQEIRRDSLSGNVFVGAPTRMNFGASLNTALFGFYPGIGPFSAIRHRVTPTLSYTFSPAVRQNELQRMVFGEVGGFTQNVITFGLNQTWEAKLKRPEEPEPADTLGQGTGAALGDTATARAPAVPSEPEKVTILSISTSSVSYDFVRAAELGNGFTTTSISNSIGSDYLRGLTINLSHDLFDQSGINPNDPLHRGRLGRFAPRLSQASTGFDLGPNSAIFRWLGLGQERSPAAQGELPGADPGQRVTSPGGGGFTGNPQALGSGPWRAAIRYAFSRPTRTYDPGNLYEDEAIQTIDLDTGFPLTTNWGVNWSTSYSITDGEFAGHRLNFKRDLHRWQANFNFYQTPMGNTGFQFYVSLIDNPDLKFDYRESNLGIDNRFR